MASWSTRSNRVSPFRIHRRSLRGVAGALVLGTPYGAWRIEQRQRRLEIRWRRFLRCCADTVPDAIAWLRDHRVDLADLVEV